jgi:hypothetical protein
VWQKISLRTRRGVPRYWNGRSSDWARAARHENKWNGIPVKISASCKVRIDVRRCEAIESDAEDGESDGGVRSERGPFGVPLSNPLRHRQSPWIYQPLALETYRITVVQFLRVTHSASTQNRTYRMRWR